MRVCLGGLSGVVGIRVGEYHLSTATDLNESDTREVRALGEKLWSIYVPCVYSESSFLVQPWT